MNSSSQALVLLLGMGAASVAAQGKPAPASSARTAATDPYAGEPSVVEHYDTVIRMNADGTGDTARHVVIRLHSEGAAQQSSVLSLFYNSANGDGTIEHVVVHKPDGTVVATPSSDSVELAAPVTREAPLYSDLKQRQLPVRSLAAGDTLEYDMRTVLRVAEAPEQFWGAEHFLSTLGVVLSETFTLQIPTTKDVQVWSPRHKPTMEQTAATRTYRWHTDQLKLTSATLPDGKPDPVKDQDTDDDGKLLPSVAWTTFHNWAEVGNWYRALAEERAQPTDALRAKANDLTAGLTAPDRQVQALYDFVSAKTRYVGIDLGVGRYQPHPAAETLSNQYGDCKDKDTLLEALLRAKGFTTAPALIGVGITPVPDLPSPALFNHVITTVMLPDKGGTPTRIWLDSTPGAEPYRVLIPQIRGQQALMVPQQQPASLVSTPAEPPFPFHEMFSAAATLDSAGLLTGQMALSVRSDAEVVVRQLQRTAAPAQWDSVAQYLSNGLGFSGTVSHASLRPSPEDGPASLTWDYRRPDYSDWSNRRILPLFPVLEVTTIADDKQPDQDIDQGTPRTLEAVTRITLPSDYRADLPSAVHIARTYATYDQSYVFSGGLLTVTRKTVILQKKVPKADWKDYTAYTKAIGMQSGENYIQLIAPENKVGTAAVADKKPVLPADSTGDSPAASATQLMARAQQQMKQNDIAGEKATLLELEKKAPDTPYTYSMLGYLAARENHFDEAVTDFKKELANHPDDDANIPILFASVYGGQKKYTEAVTLLQSYEARDGVRVSLALASYQQLAGDDDGAVGTLQRATASHGDDRQLLTAYASALHAAHRETEAAAVAKAAMDESNDAFLLNNNSYVLAETGNDLDLAEKKARQAIDLREAETAAISVAEANSAAFNASLNLVAAYDTLAYILLKEGKPEAAEPYQRAAWFGGASITIGDHLALIQEAMHHPDDALTTDELALATSGAAANKPDYAEVQQNADRLRKAGAHSHVSNAGQQLQTQRTFKVPRLPDAKGWGTFRVQVGAAGIVDSDMVSGSPAVKSMTAEVNKLKVSGGVPPASHAKLLRDGVLSCSAGQATCEFVLMPQSGLGVEGVREETRP